jgi:shikimate dehydrogenase
MDRYGLIGKKIEHSKSPQIHEYMAKRLGLNIKYDLFDIDAMDIPVLLKLVRKGNIKGLNVTTPYKKHIIKYLDKITPRAKRIGAVNTIFMVGDELVGDNTDYDGFLGLIQRNKIDVNKKNVYILGAGGAAKAAYIVLKDLGANVTVVSRSLTDMDPTLLPAITFGKIEKDHVDIYVQATPIGGYPNVGDSVLEEHLVKGKIVIDLIYHPEITKIMSFAKEAYGGLEMLIIQAIKAEEIWFNHKIDITKDLISKIKEVILA